MIAAGADVNKTANDGVTPLSAAASANHYKIAQVLLEAGADPNLANTFGKSPLFLALQHGFSDVASLLQQHGASVKNPHISNHYRTLMQTCLLHCPDLQLPLIIMENGADLRYQFRKSDST